MKFLLLACLRKTASGNVFGGAEKSIINLANWLSQQNYDVTLVSVEGKEVYFPLNEKVKFKGYEIHRKNKLGVHLDMYLNTQKAIKAVKPDVVIGFWIHPMFYLLLNPLNKNIHTFYSERNDPNLEYSIVSKIIRSFVLKKMTGIVFQTNDAKNYFSKEIQCKSKVIHNPLYFKQDEFPLKKDNDNRIVSVGRLNPQKNQLLLIEAFYELSKVYPELTLEIYGEGPLRTVLQKKICDLHMSEKIFLKGAFPDVIERIYGARVFVLSSDYEGMPNALMEAMALGIPVVSSDCPCGGPKELISEAENGFLFQCGDKQDLVNKIKYILEMDQEQIQKLKENEYVIRKTHSQDWIFNEWIQFINNRINKI